MNATEMKRAMDNLEAHYNAALRNAFSRGPVAVRATAQNDYTGNRNGAFTLYVDGGTNEENREAKQRAAEILRGLTDAKLLNWRNRGALAWYTTDGMLRRGIEWTERA